MAHCIPQTVRLRADRVIASDSKPRNIHSERLGTFDHYEVEAEDHLCIQALGDGKVKRVASLSFNL